MVSNLAWVACLVGCVHHHHMLVCSHDLHVMKYRKLWHQHVVMVHDSKKPCISDTWSTRERGPWLQRS